jgi:SAM-dependent methyltransferase
MGRTLQKIKKIISRHIIRRSALRMWKKRAKQYGRRAVLNIGHSEEELEAVTQMQKEKIFPFLKQELKKGDEKIILDLGCGMGRFTPDLAKIILGKAVGVNPIKDFIDMAPRSGNVTYRLMKESVIPLDENSVDAVWICLVLGGIIKERFLRNIVSEVNRVLKNGGLIMLIENTSEKKDGEYWKFRSLAFYRSLFDFAELKHFSDYYDLGERISIMAGRKLLQL